MERSVKIAFLGGGINSAIGRTHKIAINMDSRYELVAGCFSRNSGVNVATAEEYNVCRDRVYSSLEELLAHEKDKIDAICILTPTPNHKAEVIKCIENGISVICEKALALSSDEAKEIKDNLVKYNGSLVVTYNYTGYPMLRELRQIILNGKLGKLEQIHIEMPQESFAKLDRQGKSQKPQDWRLHDKHLSMISLDLGTHIHDIISFLSNETPVEVISVEDSFGSFHQVVDNSISIAKYTNNMICNIWFSKTAFGHRNGLKVNVYGKKGSAQWYQMEPEILYINDNMGNKQIIDRASSNVDVAIQNRYNRFKAGHPSGFIEAFANYYNDIFDFLVKDNQSENEFVFGVDDALEGLKMLEAMKKSSKSRKWELVE